MVTREQSTRRDPGRAGGARRSLRSRARDRDGRAVPRQDGGRSRAGELMEHGRGGHRLRAACCVGCATSWQVRARRRSGSTRSSGSIAADMVAEVCSCYVMRAGEVLELFATEGLRRRGGAPHPAARRRGPGRRHRRHGAAAGAGRRASASRFRLSAGDRRGDLPLADGRADPARRPRARRAGRAEPHAAQLHRGRDRGAADHRHGAGRAGRGAASW